MNRLTLYQGDALEVLRTLPSDSLDSLVCDPPAGIGFMGKGWDKDKGGRDQWIDWLASILREAHRVLKPGAHGLVWALPRTSHWTGMACEDAGFEVRDRVSHLFGTGFPKSLDISKAIDRAAGTKREVVGTKLGQPGYHLHAHDSSSEAFGHGLSSSTYETRLKSSQITAPATDAARQWQGWGTALKPACEDWWLIRKPFVGTVAANVQQHGTGALNIDGCRIEYGENEPDSGANFYRLRGLAMPENRTNYFGGPDGIVKATPSALGRWPANVTHDGSDEVLAGFPDDTERFFYCAKTSRREREAGLTGEAKQRDESRDPEAPGANNPRNRGGQERLNHHPTVKSVALMRWLVRLVTPPGGTVLDCFMGSGSTGVAAIQEGMSFVGIEQERDYVAIATARIEHAEKEAK